MYTLLNVLAFLKIHLIYHELIYLAFKDNSKKIGCARISIANHRFDFIVGKVRS